MYSARSLFIVCHRVPHTVHVPQSCRPLSGRFGCRLFSCISPVRHYGCRCLHGSYETRWRECRVGRLCSGSCQVTWYAAELTNVAKRSEKSTKDYLTPPVRPPCHTVYMILPHCPYTICFAFLKLLTLLLQTVNLGNIVVHLTAQDTSGAYCCQITDGLIWKLPSVSYCDWLLYFPSNSDFWIGWLVV
jgi:hypothetical protein